LTSPRPAVESAWRLPAADVAERLGVTIEPGLDESQVERRRQEYGPNQVREAARASAWQILVRQFKSLIVGLLSLAAVVSFLFAEWLNGFAIIAVLLITAALGFVAELRAVRSMEALRRLGSVRTSVRRGGSKSVVKAEELVPGDVVLFEGGDAVTADARLVEASRLQADESTLTGESVPVGKSVDELPDETPLAERTNMLFRGTTVTRGSAVGVVVATGMATELGNIAGLVEAAEEEEEITPLERRLADLGRRLVWVTLGIATVAAVAGILAGKDPLFMVETGIALAVAAIPEGLPIVATIALARGMWRMARRGALINRLGAVETLGATTLIVADKTGTLTENRMTLRRLALDSGDVTVGGEGLSTSGAFERDGELLEPLSEPLLASALEVAVLCNNASLPALNGDGNGNGDGTASGDPLEVALRVAGAKAGLDHAELLVRKPRRHEEAFDPSTKMMATVHDDGDGLLVAVKGAAEAVLDVSTTLLTASGSRPLDDEGREHWLERNRRMAGEGLRVLALARKRAESASEPPYRGLSFVGLVGLLDPPREQAREAIESCRRAGIRVVMVTGDQAATAESIARAIGLIGLEDEAGIVEGRALRVHRAGDRQEGEGDAATSRRLLEAPIFARFEPAQKLDLVALYQDHGNVVAMTGDGVNDAPALKKADIGIAMGKRGTRVAQEAAEMVLTDDAFSSIVAAIHQGRVIFANIRKFVVYLLSCNVSEIMVVGVASGLAVPLPILPLQILYLNLVTDVFPALALALGEGDARVMERPPRDPSEPVLTRAHWARIGGFGLVITVSVLAALLAALYWLGLDERGAVTVSFSTLALAQLWHVFNLRDRGSSLLGNDVVRNPWVWGALALCVLLVVAAVHLPGLSTVLQTADPGARGWALAVGLSLLPWLVGQLWAARPAISGAA
jgi:Ca2+-transporting ATPase